MTCSFCGGPAHDATGCRYGPRTLACYACTVEFWRWVRSHTNKRPPKGKGTPTALTFYECVRHLADDERRRIRKEALNRIFRENPVLFAALAKGSG